MPQVERPWLALLCSSLLVGCISSAGGDDESGSGDSDGTETVSAVSGEGSTISQAFEFEIEAVEGIRTDPSVSVAINGSSVDLTVGDLENDVTVRYRVKGVDGTERIFAIELTNTSALPLVEEARSLADATADLVVADDLQLAEIVLDLEYLAGLTTPEEVSIAISDFESEVASASGLFESQVQLVSNAISGYQEGDVPERELRLAVSDAQVALGPLNTAGSNLLLEVRDSLTDLGVSLPSNPGALTPIEFVEEGDRYSRFMTDAYGAFGVDGSFSFHDSADFLNAVFNYASGSNG